MRAGPFILVALAAIGATAVVANDDAPSGRSPGDAQVQGPAVEVGTAAPPDAHIIVRPGLYGLGPEPADSRYAIVGASLVRLDAATRVVRAVIRPQVVAVD